jgi:hypothetical protein
VRRLTRREYDNTMRDLLGETRRLGARFVAEEQALGFDNDAELLGMSTILAEQQMGAAELVAARAVRDLPSLLGCDPATTAPSPCVRTFIARLGKRAWRRPLDAREQEALFRSYERARGWGDVAAGVRALLEALLEAPDFVYRIEVGRPAPRGASVTALTPYEVASRLSYLIWGSMPDEALFAEADAGRLSTPAQVAAQARRLMADPRAHATVADFHRQWLALDAAAHINRDAKRFPRFTDALRKPLVEEGAALADHVFWNADGRLATLLTAPYAFVNGALAAFYGVAAPAAGDYQRVDMDPARRSGLLTRGAFLAAQAKVDQTSPIHRGIYVRRRLLCGTTPPPKQAFDPPRLDPALTTRERFEEHRSDVGCNACHRLFDPIGLAFENYDAVGLYRDTENGKPVDASGEIVDADVAGPFTGAVELGRKLAASADVRRCLVTQWFRFGYGRTETDEDRCTLDALEQRLADAGDDMRELLVALTQTDAFLYRKADAR